MSGRSFPQQRYVAPTGASQILLVRHGESQTYVEGQPFPVRPDGQGDPPLTEIGQQGAQQVSDRLTSSGERIAALYVTTLQRTHQTAAPLAAALNLDPVEIADLREHFLGEWEAGISRAKFADRDPIAQKVVETGSFEHIPGAEPNQDFTERVRRGIELIANRHRDQLAVAVVHGGVIGRVIQIATGCSQFSFSVDNASITHLVVESERWRIRAVNDTSHRWATFDANP